MSLRHIERFTAEVHKHDTRELATQIMFGEEQAGIIASFCDKVDYYEDTKPTNIDASAQRWHFNICGGQDGTMRDSRMKLAIECLNMAINVAVRARTINNEVLKHLGHGLHPLQDIFAHTRELISTAKDYSLNGWGLYFASFFADVPKYSICPCSHKNILSSAPDNRDYIHPRLSPRSTVLGEENFSQRYSDAITATKLYLILFWDALKAPVHSSVISEIRERMSTSNSKAFNSLLQSFGKTLDNMESIAHLREGDFHEWKSMQSMAPVPGYY